METSLWRRAAFAMKSSKESRNVSRMGRFTLPKKPRTSTTAFATKSPLLALAVARLYVNARRMLVLLRKTDGGEDEDFVEEEVVSDEGGVISGTGASRVPSGPLLGLA